MVFYITILQALGSSILRLSMENRNVSFSSKPESKLKVLQQRKKPKRPIKCDQWVYSFIFIR